MLSRRFIICLVFGCSLGPGLSAHTQTIPSTLNANKRPVPPRRLPPNHSQPGGGLDPSAQSCGPSQHALTALIPTQNPVLTATPHPTFLVYVSDRPQDLQGARFSILSANAKRRIYQTHIPLDQAPGIVKIQLPQNPETALEIGKAYQWHFDVDCQPGNMTQHLNVNGWVIRVAKPQASSGQALIWYDTLADLSQRLQHTPQDANARDRWSSLLESVGLENLPPQATVLNPKTQE
jgi:hypothetical protein